MLYHLVKEGIKTYTLSLFGSYLLLIVGQTHSSVNNGYDIKLGANRIWAPISEVEANANGTEVLSAYSKKRQCWPWENLNNTKTSS